MALSPQCTDLPIALPFLYLLRPPPPEWLASHPDCRAASERILGLPWHPIVTNTQDTEISQAYDEGSIAFTRFAVSHSRLTSTRTFNSGSVVREQIALFVDPFLLTT